MLIQSPLEKKYLYCRFWKVFIVRFQIDIDPRDIKNDVG